MYLGKAPRFSATDFVLYHSFLPFGMLILQGEPVNTAIPALRRSSREWEFFLCFSQMRSASADADCGSGGRGAQYFPGQRLQADVLQGLPDDPDRKAYDRASGQTHGVDECPSLCVSMAKPRRDYPAGLEEKTHYSNLHKLSCPHGPETNSVRAVFISLSGVAG